VYGAVLSGFNADLVFVDTDKRSVAIIAFVFGRWTTIDLGVGVVMGGDAVVLFTFEGVGLAGSFQPIDCQESVDADPATNLIAR
jgi:hypothetical protein